MQQLYYLQQQENNNVARRVASLSHLPSLKPSQSQSFGFISNPAVSAAAATSTAAGNSGMSIGSGSGIHAQGFLLGGNQISSSFVSHMHTSPLAQISSNQYSPALSSASFRDFDEAITPGPQLDSAALNSEWLRVHASQHQHQHQHPSPQQQLLKSAQRKTLTSSISMQTLPRFKIPTNWEQPQQQSASSGGLSSLSPSMSNTTNATYSSMSSQSSAATLIDSDVWSSSSYAGYGIDQSNSSNGCGSGGLVKPQESRFFPAPSSASSGNRLGSYYGTRTHPHSQYQQQLRRQQSTDDWVSLRNAYASSSALASAGYALDVSVAGLNISNMNNSPDLRISSVDHMRNTATGSRKQANPLLYNSMLCL
ncbi:hypothetical protein LPJ75_001352 [Coemansia sp. RSA 2598]|nr:hypothetical protein LPJ75_001352 [Coemansia sp. RSA 2598]